MNFRLKGILKYKDKTYYGSKISVDDLKEIAFLAFDEKWYDNCITFLRAIQNHETILDPQIQNLKQKVVEIHNQLVLKRKERISEQDTKVFPFLIDELTLKKKSKQPKWVKTINWYDRGGQADCLVKVNYQLLDVHFGTNFHTV